MHLCRMAKTIETDVSQLGELSTLHTAKLIRLLFMMDRSSSYKHNHDFCLSGMVTEYSSAPV